MKSTLAACLLALLAQTWAAPPHHREPDQPQILAPGYSDLDFAAPTAGSYALPPVGPAADGAVLDEAGRPTSLHALYAGKVVVLGFIFTSCSDVNGCPLATYVLSRVQRRLLDDSDLTARVRLISLSFDPGHDTPEVMRAYAENFRKDGVDWDFLTCSSEAKLQPILAAYGQSVIRDYDADGRDLGSMSHLLRVYLIDREQRIRNIYSPAFLHPDILLADIRTVLLEDEL